METGQLYMQTAARSMTDFASMAATAAPSAAIVKKDSGSFDGMLREVTPQRYNRPEQTTRSEAKSVPSKKAEKLEEPVKLQTTSKTVEASIQRDSKTEESNQKSQKVTDEKKQEDEMGKAEMPIPQNAEMPVATVQLIAVQQLPEDRMSESADSEKNLNAAIDQVEAQNATNNPAPPTNADNKMLIDMTSASQSTVQQVESIAEAVESKSADVALPQVSPVTTTSVQQDEALKVQFGKMEKPTTLPQPVAEKDSKNSAPSELKQTEVQSADIQKTTIDTAQLQGKSDSNRLKADSVTKVVSVAPEAPSTASNAAVLRADAQLLAQVEKVQAQPTATEFRFARSSAVDLAIEVVGQAVDQPKVGGEGVSAIETRPSDSTKIAEVSQGSFKGSDSGLNGNSQEAFSQQNLDLPKPAMLPTANASLAAASNVSPASSTVQAVPQELSRTASSESVAGQVREQLSTRNIKQGNEQITIQLSPDHLGDIKVNFRLEDQKLRVEIVAENRNARESLLQHADSLKESLARQNINMEKFEVTGGNSGSTTGQGAYSQPEWREMAKNRQTQQWLSSGGYRTQMNGAEVSAPVYFARAENSTLDLHF